MVDTQVEVFERKLDRAIENKERITLKLALGFGDDFKMIVKLVNNLQNALADTLNIFWSGTL